MKPLGSHTVSAPDGTEWSVRRIWFGERQLKTREWRMHAGSRLTDGDVGVADLFDGLNLESGLVLIAAVVAVALILLPILLFGVELIILGVLLAAGLVSRSLFGKPWTVAATRDGAVVPAGLWRVKGWRASHALIRQICAGLSADGELAGDVPETDFIERVA